jgi:hypothetical protein
VTVTDIVPVQRGDFRGVTGFYLVIGWIVGGYLVAALLGVASGARPATFRRALNRLIAFVPYAILSGLFFVILGNPSAGGAYQPTLLPPFWRAISSARPNGAGTDSHRGHHQGPSHDRRRPPAQPRSARHG